MVGTLSEQSLSGIQRANVRTSKEAIFYESHHAEVGEGEQF